jgi:outer membrane protein assembly factor BamB
VIRIRPGRSWRHNPGYLGELRSLLGPEARAFDGGGILDVVGIEVDGVDIAAGVGEAEVLVAVDELCAALRHLDEGSPAAQATVGRGPTELLLEARGNDVLLSLVTLAPPARLLASGLLLDGDRLRAAVRAAAKGLAEDLLSISPLLAHAPIAKRLRNWSRARRSPPPWPHPVPGRAFVARGAHGGVRCEVQVPEEAAWRLAGTAQVPHAPLAPLLGSGSVALRFPGAPALSWEGQPYLALRNLVREAEHLVQAWESGDPAFTLHFGPVEVRCDLTADEVRASGFRSGARAAPPDLALALAGAAHKYADKALRIAGAAEAIDDLRTNARRLEEHCRDLASGDLRRAPEAVAAPPARRAPNAPQAPLATGRIRRLVYRTVWRTEPGTIPTALLFFPGALLCGFRDQVLTRDAETGRAIWRAACLSFVRGAADDLYLADTDSVSRLDPASGDVRWNRRVRRGDPRMWAGHLGVLRALPDGIARITDAGTLAFRARLSCGAPAHVACADRAVVCAGDRTIVALDEDGAALWKRRLRGEAIALAAAPGRALLLERRARSGARLAAFAPHSGKLLWERPLQGGSELVVAHDSVLVAHGRDVAAARLADGTLRSTAVLPFEPLRLSCGDEAVVATGPGGAAARIDERGASLWTLPPEGGDSPAPAVVQRGVVLLARGGAALHDAREGLPIAHLGEAAPLCAALAPDLSAAVCDGTGAVSLHRLATHLSVVTT